MASRLSLFLAEMKRRKVGRVAAVYAVVGVAVIEAADLILTRMTLPEWTVDFVVVLVVLGFPIALVLAWALEVTPEGIQKTPDLTQEELAAKAPERWSPGWMGLATAAVLVCAAGAYLIFFRGGGAAPEEDLVHNRVFVTLFENQTGDPALEPAGRMAADFIIRDLVMTGVVEVLPIETALALAEQMREGTRTASLQDEARTMGAAYMVSGSFFAQGDSLVVQGQVLDLARGQVQTALGPVTTFRAEPGAGFTELAQRSSGALAVLVDPTFSPGFSTMTPPVSYAGYAEMAAGADAFMHLDFAEAIDRFARAVDLDSTYLAPLIMMSVAYRNRGMYGASDSVRLIAERFRDRANPAERASLDLQRAWYDGDREGAFRAMERAAAIDPGGTSGFQYGYEAIRTNRLRQAVEILEGMDPSRPDMASWTSYWSRLTSAYHMLGEYDNELQTAYRGQAQIPASRTPVIHEHRALIGLGRIDEALEGLEELRARETGQGTIRDMALEFRAHGHPEVAREVLNQVLEWYDAQPSDLDTQRGLRSGRAETLYRLERWAEARSIYLELLAEDPTSPAYLGRLGCIAARLGEREEALRFSDELAALEQPYLWGGNTLWQARIAALLGDHDRAVSLLNQAHREGRAYSLGFHRDMDLESLRGHPGFEEFLRPRG